MFDFDYLFSKQIKQTILQRWASCL